MQPAQHVDRTSFLAISLELSVASWRLAASDGRRQRPSTFRADAVEAKTRLQQVVDLVGQIKRRWALPADVRVVLLYEAGQDGFWIARALEAEGIEVVVCDPKSIPVPRDARRAKTDRLDAIQLLESLLGWLRGERSRLRAVHMPSPEAEAQRHLARDRGQLQKEIGQHRDRMRKLLRLHGCWVAAQANVPELLAAGQLCCWDGSALPPELLRRLQTECERLEIVQAQFKKLEGSLGQTLAQPVRQRIERLQTLCGVGPIGATRLELEFFWRDFHNRRQVGAALGLVPQPYDSGESHRDQGISKASNRRVRSLSIEMSWMWLKYQPDSDITKWYVQRTKSAGKRIKRIAVVAVARRLMIALWRYATDGVVPAGSRLKTS
jgi:transposase